jgi:asparagine synthase (glutamine-hydrolysing)
LFLNYGYTPLDNTTYFNEIKRFPKSSFSFFNFSNHLNYGTNQYYSIYAIQKKVKIKFSEAVQEFSNLFTQSINIRNRSDVEIGVSISGGIDSTLIIQYLSQLLGDKKLKNFSSISPQNINDESKFIYEVQKHFDVEAFFVNPLEEFKLSDFYDFLSHVEFPVKTMSFYAQWNVSKLMRNNGVTINLVGQGADEVFGGYHTHYIRYLRFLILKGKIISYIKEVNAYSEIKGIKKNILHRIVILDIGVLLMFKMGLKKIDIKMLNHWNKTSDITEFLKNDLTIYQLPFFLHSDDRSSMAHSIETRHPFLDYRIVDFGFSLPNTFCFNKGWSKYILRKSINDSLNKIKWRKDKKGYVIPNNELIKEILPESKNLQFDFRKLCLDSLFK